MKMGPMRIKVYPWQFVTTTFLLLLRCYYYLQIKLFVKYLHRNIVTYYVSLRKCMHLLFVIVFGNRTKDTNQ